MCFVSLFRSWEPRMPKDITHWNSNVLISDRPEFSVERYVRDLPEPEDFDLKGKLDQWRDQGIVTFNGVVNDKDLATFESDIRFLNEHRHEFEIETEYRGKRYKLRDVPVPPLSDTGVKFNCLENISLAARRLSLNRFIVRFLSHVFHDSPVQIQSLTFWRGSEQPAHLDYPWVCVQERLPHLAASWIPLEDIHPDAGPLAYYPGSHKVGIIQPFDWGGGSLIQEPESTKTPSDFSAYLQNEISRLNLKREVFLPRRGDLLIWHGNVLHEGTKVNDKSRTRRSYVSHYTSLGSYPRDHMYPDAFEARRYTTACGGYVFDHPWVSDQRLLPSWL